MTVEKNYKKTLRLEAETARLRGATDRFVRHASTGDVNAMLLEGLTVQDALERIAKVVTGTEVML